jgi:hypothetical protein
MLPDGRFLRAWFLKAVFIESWFDGLPEDWRFEFSPNGWTSDVESSQLSWLRRKMLGITHRCWVDYM